MFKKCECCGLISPSVRKGLCVVCRMPRVVAGAECSCKNVERVYQALPFKRLRLPSRLS